LQRKGVKSTWEGAKIRVEKGKEEKSGRKGREKTEYGKGKG
jgi:hypothetical protein